MSPCGRLAQVLSGYIESRDLSGELYIHVQARSQASRTTRLQIGGVLERHDLADGQDHQYCFKMKRWFTKADWESAQRYQVDIEIEPAVVLEYEPQSSILTIPVPRQMVIS